MLRAASSLRPLLSGAPVASTSRAVVPPRARSHSSRPQVSWDADVPQSSVPHWERDSKSWSAPRRENKSRVKQHTVVEHKPPTPEERKRHQEMRVRRAERLERKDLTAQLTETKTYMGGFTQPRHLQYLTTLDPTRKEKDSREVRVGPNRTRPAAEAYEPHTVYLAVTRYPIRWGHGRQTRRECFSGYCRESELEDRFRALNYGTWAEETTELVKLKHGQPRQPVTTPAHWACHDDSKEYLDLAVFPGSPEERALLNKPAGRLLAQLRKERVRLVRDAEAAASDKDKADIAAPGDFLSDKGRTVAELDALIDSCHAQLAPPVKGWTRPSPPYTSPPLVVPLVTVTLPTRPLAATLARLCNGHARGLPFIASIPVEDRKDGPALFRRLLRMRANRLQQVARELVYKLEGHAGGLMGLRLSPEERGRGIEGEGLGERVSAPERGWVEVSWLDPASECWTGLARDEYLASWDDLEGAKSGPYRRDDAKWLTPHPLVPDRAVEGAAPVDEALRRADPVEAARPVEEVEPVEQDDEAAAIGSDAAVEKAETVEEVEEVEPVEDTKEVKQG
ncbi:hypothetical protein JCM3770_006212 [Rhodotorula araucariae]